jgi:hypothetical protein
MKPAPLAVTLSLFAAAVCSASPFAASIVQYNPGAGFAAGYTNPAAALGAPSQVSNDPTYGPSPVDPFDGPYLTNQIVSIGTGGSLTVVFDTPVFHNPAHPYGLDFIVFCHAAFDTAPNYDGIANGSLFGNSATQTVVSVSADGTNFYQLDPTKAPRLDALFPTDGSGDPGIPVNPSFAATNFAGLDLPGVRRLYARSAGGAGYNIAWAIDSQGHPATLASIRYVRLQVLSGKAEIDALSATSVAPIPTGRSGWSEDFSFDPSASGWASFGDAASFFWDTTNQNLNATWDSSKPNSYYYRPLGATLTQSNNFSASFDLSLRDIAIGAETNKPGTFELTLGLINLQQAIKPAFLRATGTNSPDLFEFDYFPDSGFGATLWPTLTDSNSDFIALNYVILPLQPAVLYHVEMDYFAVSNLLTLAMTANGQPFTNLQSAVAFSLNTGFSLDTFAVESYSSAGQDPSYAGSILAHGTVDNVQISYATTAPPALSVTLASGAAGISFNSISGYLYTLQRTSNFQSWTNVVTASVGDGGQDLITDSNPPAAAAFYRLQVQSP